MFPAALSVGSPSGVNQPVDIHLWSYVQKLNPTLTHSPTQPWGAVGRKIHRTLFPRMLHSLVTFSPMCRTHS